MKPKTVPSSSSSDSNTTNKDTKQGYQGMTSVMFSCFAPRSSPTNFESGGGNGWSEKYDYHRMSTLEAQSRIRRNPLLGCHSEQSHRGGRPPKPFASNPLLDRDDSLVHDGSLLSLVASECETRSYEDVPVTPIYKQEQRTPKPFESSPLISRDDSLLQGGSLLSLIASQDETLNEVIPSTPRVSYAKYNSRVLQTPSGDNSSASWQHPIPPPPSPALELSAAKQQVGLMMGNLNMRREVSRGSLFPKVDSVVSLGNVVTEQDVSCSSAPVEERSTGEVDPAKYVPPLDSLQNPTPIWSENDNIHPELKRTYCYPRLFANDPSNIVGQFEMPWWYLLSKRIHTTLNHAFDFHWQEMEMQQLREHGTINNSTDTISNDSGQLIRANSPCSPDAIVDLCSDNTLEDPRLQKPQSNRLSVISLSDVSPINAWSEPSASTVKVRGKNYAKDGIKVESDAALFACLGVDSFVTDRGVSAKYSNTAHYLGRWKKVSQEVGLETTPFLLVINFVVPWGNFQSYSFRPDADDGPFSTKYRDRPSEIAWRQFMEGDEEHRNKCLKLIPRVCAGPWVVKKMIGSTPAIIGTKLPVTYRGSKEENYLEIVMDVTKGPAFGNTVANTVVGKADMVTVDLGFVIEGQEMSATLPEQMLSLIRLHHLEMNKACNIDKWIEELNKSQAAST